VCLPIVNILIRNIYLLYKNRIIKTLFPQEIIRRKQLTNKPNNHYNVDAAANIYILVLAWF